MRNGKDALADIFFSSRYFWGACLLGILTKEVKWAKSLFETNFAQCKWDDRQIAERDRKQPQKVVGLAKLPRESLP